MALGLFKKNKKQTTNDRYLTLTIKEVVPIAKDAVNLVFQKPEQPFNYQPGQFLTIIQKVHGEKIRRAYSLCSTPAEDEHPAVTVKRVKNGRMSNHINDHFKAGEKVEAMEPMGLFTTEYHEKNERHAVFIGGGSGITPLIAILRTLLIKEPHSKATLIYANRSQEYILFDDLLNDLENKYGDRLQLIHVLETDEAQRAKLQGRLSEGIVSSWVNELQLNKAEFYICGPQPMMDAVVLGLKNASISEEAIRLESFEAGKTTPDAEKKVQGNLDVDSEVTILLDGETHVVHVPMNASILDTALDAGLDMPYSCQSGLCTACRGKCTEGSVSTEDADGLSQQELDDGYVLTCIGKPRSATIKLEIG